MGQFNPFICGLNNSSSGGNENDGKSISVITFVSSTGGTTAGIAGATDTYEIIYTDNSKSSFIVTNGKNGTDGQNGKDGKNGKDGRDGQNGQDGISILSVTLDSTEGLIDTYIIHYSDNSTSYFSVTNGKDGKSAYEIAVEYGYQGTEEEWIQIFSKEIQPITKEQIDALFLGGE